MLEMFLNYVRGSGFGQFTWGNGVMIAIGLVFIYLAIRKKFEPLLLVPIGFGMLIGNIPYDTSKLSLGVYDGPVDESILVYYTAESEVDFAGVTVPPWHQVYPPPEGSGIPARRYLARDLVERGLAVMVNPEEKLVYGGAVEEPGVIELAQGRRVLAIAKDADGRYPTVVPPQHQNPLGCGVSSGGCSGAWRGASFRR